MLRWLSDRKVYLPRPESNRPGRFAFQGVTMPPTRSRGETIVIPAVELRDQTDRAEIQAELHRLRGEQDRGPVAYREQFGVWLDALLDLWVEAEPNNKEEAVN